MPRLFDADDIAECAASKAVLEQQLEVLQELLEVEEGCKWALYTQTQLLQELAALEEEQAASDARASSDPEAARCFPRLSALCSALPLSPSRSRSLSLCLSLSLSEILDGVM